MEISESINLEAAHGVLQQVSALHVATCADEVMRRWSEQVKREIPAVGNGEIPALGAFLPVLFDNIAEAIAPGIGRPFATDRSCILANSLWTDTHIKACNTDDVIKELQIFRNVVFAVVKSRSLCLTESQYQRMGDLIDLALRQAITACAALDRATRETVMSELSHDLRNPLNIASALAQLIQRRPDNEKVAMMATRIYEKIAETDAMIQATVDTLAKKQGADPS